jgi:hypothetical protein
MKHYSEDEIIQSIEGIKQAEAPPFMRTRVFAKLKTHETVSWRWVPAMAALLLLGILLSNIILFSQPGPVSQENATDIQQFSQTYSLPLTTTIYEQHLEQ